MTAFSSLVRAIALAALGLPAATSALAGDECTFAPPSPLLRPHVYPKQAVTSPGLNQLVEKAQLRPDLHIEIRQGGCVDFVSTEFILVAIPSMQRSEREWIDLARTGIANLQTGRPNDTFTDLIAFLKQAHRLPLHEGKRVLCRDGAAPDADGCSWERLGGYELSIKHTGTSTHISARQYVSG